MQRLRPGTLAQDLATDTVHVYEMNLDGGPHNIAAHLASLSPRERAQAGRFATPDLTRKYVLSHSGMHWALAQHLKISPSEVTLDYGAHGKPCLGPVHARALEFNLSHSGEKCLLAIASNMPIGIDIERVRRLGDWYAIASRFFSEREAACLASLPADDLAQAFFATWARKESYIKALGLGLSLSLSAFEVEVLPNAAARLIWALDEAEGPSAWSLCDLDINADYRAAIAIRGHHYRIQRWQVDWSVVINEERSSEERSSRIATE